MNQETVIMPSLIVAYLNYLGLTESMNVYNCQVFFNIGFFLRNNSGRFHRSLHSLGNKDERE